MREETERYLRATFWLVVGMAGAVVIMLGLLVYSVSQQAETANIQSRVNAELIDRNAKLITTLDEQTRTLLDTMFCLLLIPDTERTQLDIDNCTILVTEGQ